jgi:hypothetical protein
MNRIPSNPLDSSDGGLVQTLDTESRNFIKGATPVLKSMIGCSGCRAERLPTILATVSTSFPPSSRVEAMANDLSGSRLSLRAAAVWTAETLHVSWTLSTPELMAWN